MFPKSTLTPDYSQLDPEIAPLVKVVNAIGLPTSFTCAGRRPRELVQFAYPVVCITPGLSAEQAPRFLWLVGMLGLFNSNCRSRDDVSWVLTSIGNPDLCICLSPEEKDRPLPELQRGIAVLANNLRMMAEWYQLEP